MQIIQIVDMGAAKDKAGGTYFHPLLWRIHAQVASGIKPIVASKRLADRLCFSVHQLQPDYATDQAQYQDYPHRRRRFIEP